MLLRIVAGLFLSALEAAAAQAQATNSIAKWVVNFDAAQCVASRDYGAAAQPLTLVLKAPPLGDVMQVGVIRRASGGEPEQVDAIIFFDGQSVRTTMLAFRPKGGDSRVHVINMPAADFARMAVAKNFGVRSRGIDVRMALLQMPSLLKIMNECVEDLRKAWNVTAPDATSPLAERATANLARLFSDGDYPMVSLRQGDSGVVRFALLIDEAGKVADCTVIATSGAAALDVQTCATVRARAKFKPAAGADGKPAKDSTVATVRWRIAP